jgi:hypothetical protein
MMSVGEAEICMCGTTYRSRTIVAAFDAGHIVSSVPDSFTLLKARISGDEAFIDIFVASKQLRPTAQI